MIQIQLMKRALCSGRVLRLIPWLACEFGVAGGLVVSQVSYLAKDADGLVRISYSRLQKQLPFFSRRWLMKVVADLEEKGVLVVIRNGRVNHLRIGAYERAKSLMESSHDAAMLVFPELACEVGLLEAVALQQIHLRCCLCDGSAWAMESLKQWQEVVFPFLSPSTVQRLFTRLHNRQLTFRKVQEEGAAYEYRVNYLRVSEVLGAPFAPFPKLADGQIDPFDPLGLGVVGQNDALWSVYNQSWHSTPHSEIGATVS